MDFKKCVRCGNFFMSVNSVCSNCEPKDKFDASNFDSYITGNPDITSIQMPFRPPQI